MSNTCIKSLDIFSPKVSLFFEGKKKYFSLIGLVMSFVCFAEIFGFGLYFSIQYVRGEQKNVIYTKDLTNNIIEGNLMKKVFFYKITDLQGNDIDPRILITVPTYFDINSTKTDVKYLTESPCSNNYTYDSLIDFDISKFTCVSRPGYDNLTLASNKLPYGLEYINIYVSKCQNSTRNNNHCFSPETINEMIEKNQFYFQIYSEVYSVDHELKYPIYSSIYTEKIPLYDNLMNIYNYAMRKVKYESDDGKFMAFKRYYEDFGLDVSTRSVRTYPKGVGSYVEGTLLTVHISMEGSYIENYKRSYQKLQSVVASLGGISSIAYVSSQIITLIFCKGRILITIHQKVKEENMQLKLIRSRVQSRYGTPKLNNLISQNRGLQTERPSSTSIANKRKFKFFEILLYHSWKNNKNCRYLREYEKNIKRYLNIKNLILFWREYEKNKLEALGTFQNDKSTLGFLTKGNYIVNSSNESSFNFDHSKKSKN